MIAFGYTNTAIYTFCFIDMESRLSKRQCLEWTDVGAYPERQAWIGTGIVAGAIDESNMIRILQNDIVG